MRKSREGGIFKSDIRGIDVGMVTTGVTLLSTAGKIRPIRKYNVPKWSSSPSRSSKGRILKHGRHSLEYLEQSA